MNARRRACDQVCGGRSEAPAAPATGISGGCVPLIGVVSWQHQLRLTVLTDCSEITMNTNVTNSPHPNSTSSTSVVNGRALSPAERRQRDRERMIEAILLNARQIMREQGVAALNLRELARRLRFTVQALYRYYPSKMALYDALFLEGIRIASAGWDEAMESGGSIWDKLGAGL